MGFCAIRPPVNCDFGGDIVTGCVTVRGCGRPVARDVDFVAITAGALTVVLIRVCLFGAVLGGTVRAGVPPPLVLVVVLDPLDEVERDALELDLLELDPLELDPLDEPPPLERPPRLELDPLELPPPLELPRLELDPLDEPPAPADPVPERRANLSAPH